MDAKTADPSYVAIEKQNGELIECRGYRTHKVKLLICYLFGVLTVGFLFLVFYWKPEWKLKATSLRCPLKDADAVLIKDIYRRYHVAQIQISEISKNGLCPPEVLKEALRRDVITEGQLRLFRFQKMKFVWDPVQKTFFSLRALESNIPITDIFDKFANGLSIKEAEERRFIYGANEIFIRLRPILVLLVQEVLNPFYMFQIFSVSVWLADEYYYYSGCIILMSTISISLSLYTTRKQNVTLREMVESRTTVLVQRNNEDNVIELPEQDLVPGDVIHIPPHGCMMSSDAVLISGNCIVNESMLTGESVPVTKTALSSASTVDDSEFYSSDTHKRNTLFCGTRILQTRQDLAEPVRAIVVQTGFATTKGSLVRSILFPKPMEFKLHRDAMRFVGCLAALAFLGFIYAIVIMTINGASLRRIILRSMDVITIAVPPALPAALTIGMLYAQLRLKQKSIFCISPQRINTSGSLDVVCFDKTGTLTEDGLDLMGIREAAKSSFVDIESIVENVRSSAIKFAMATCHSLAVIDGEITGDPIDIKMFQATKWILNEPDGYTKYFMSVTAGSTDKNTKDERFIIKQFPFSSGLQRMSVLTHVRDADHMIAYVKGSPEMIASLSAKESIPADFNEVLASYAKEGFRVLALASTVVDSLPNQAGEINRNDVEKDLTFLGLMVMQNKLKPETAEVIRELQDANIRTVMITGDNILTAINIARKCGMCNHDDLIVRIDVEDADEDGSIPTLNYEVVETGSVEIEPTCQIKEMTSSDVLLEIGNSQKRKFFALDGKTFAAIKQYHQHVIPNVVSKSLVLARMSPDQKQEFVEYLQQYEYFVGMCGDGANDCGALKTAHAGISLSEAEASVASPFTSKVQNISCVPALIKEGRAALVTSFAMFKYMALYSMIQFTSVMILYSIQSGLGDIMFHYIDIFLCTVTVLLMTRGEAYEKLSVKKPLSKLMKAPIIFSLLVHILVQAAFQVAMFMIVKLQPWYVPVVALPDEKNIVAFETTSVFLLSCFQYISVALVFTPRPPFRLPLYKLPLYAVSLVVVTVVTSVIVIFAPPKIEKFFLLEHIPQYWFKGSIIGIAALHLLVSCVIEYVIVPNKTLMKIVGFTYCRKKKRDRYQQLDMEVMENTTNT